ncbi:hypothetical protein LTR74_009794 [Friedmanniomyces endolithicus]|nr:hypothetical protein LTR74_009794 [Friedmanniomyces endolithicus]
MDITSSVLDRTDHGGASLRPLELDSRTMDRYTLLYCQQSLTVGGQKEHQGRGNRTQRNMERECDRDIVADEESCETADMASESMTGG